MKDWESAETLFEDLKRANYDENGSVELYLAQVAEETGRYAVAFDRYRAVPDGERSWIAKIRAMEQRCVERGVRGRAECTHTMAFLHGRADHTLDRGEALPLYRRHGTFRSNGPTLGKRFLRALLDQRKCGAREINPHRTILPRACRQGYGSHH